MTPLQPKQFPEQLQMFMKPSEIYQAVEGQFNDVWYMDESDDEWRDLRVQKLQEADDPADPLRVKGGRSLTRQITEEGVRKPVSIEHSAKGWPPMLFDHGHHRFFVQERREQQGEEVYLPVEHSYSAADRTK